MNRITRVTISLASLVILSATLEHVLVSSASYTSTKTIASSGMVLTQASEKASAFHAAINVAYGAGQGFDQADIQRIENMGFDAVRLSIYWGKLQPDSPDSVDTSIFTTSQGVTGTYGMDSYVNWAGALNMKAIVVLGWTETWGPPNWAGLGPWTAHTQFERLINDSTGAQWGYRYAFQKIAERYANYNNVVLEFINEPSVSSISFETAYKNMIEMAVDQVRSVETTVTHLILAPILVEGTACEETLTQPDVNRADFGWVTHRYQPGGDYNPSAPALCYDYVTQTWGWSTMDKYVYWRVRRCAGWIAGTGKPWYNTEVGKEMYRANWQTWLNYVLSLKQQLGCAGWTYNDYDRFDGSGFSIIDADNSTNTTILSILQPYMH